MKNLPRTLASRAMFGLFLAVAVALAAGGKQNLTQKAIELPADNALATLKPGPGVDAVRANCVACHSTDYIVRQPGGDAKRWQAEVEKMIKVFGAPVNQPDAKTIAEYLATAYSEEDQSRRPVTTPSKAPK